MKTYQLVIFYVLLAFLLPLEASYGQVLNPNDSKSDDPAGGGGGLDSPAFCVDFSNGNTGGWVSNPADEDIVSVEQPGPSGDPSDSYLFVEEDSGYDTWLENETNYDGDWLAEGSCFCFDVNLFEGEDQPTSHPYEITLQITGTGGVAEFLFDVDLENGQGWVGLCAPIEQCTGTTLPSNEFGQWVITTGSNSCNTWNSIVSNVTMVRIIHDDGNFPDEEVGFDNICLSDCRDVSTTCCDKSPNLIFNGNFALGDQGFNSDYTFTSDYSPNSIAPGMYGVASAAQAAAVSPLWVLEDPSSCDGLPNDRVMLVNGRTQQPGSGLPPQQQGTLVWEQFVQGVSPGDYQFCGKFKNLPQAAFDIKPEVFIQIQHFTNLQNYGPFTIDGGPNGCDWERINAEFEVTNSASSILLVRIFVDHLGNGDGNDLAIDDLALHRLEEVQFGMYAGGATSGPGIEGSFGANGSGDDGTFDASCDYLWRVTNVTGGFVMGVGNNNGSSSGPAWPLTTTFPTLAFQPLTTYRIALELSNCDCFADNDNWVEVTLGPNGKVSGIQTSSSGNAGATHDSQNQKTHQGQEVNFFPNPTTSILRAQIGHQKTDLQLTDLHGRVLRKWTLSENAELDLSDHPAGIYYLQYQSETSKGSTKIILQ